MQTDDKIIKRVLNGHKDEFRQLVARYQEQVYRVAYGILGSHEAASDASQETFVRAYQNLESFGGKGPFGGWLRRISVNVSLRRIPRELPSEDVEQMIDLQCDDWNPVEAEVLRSSEIAEIRRHIASLPAKQRAVLVLRYHEELSYKEICEALDEPLSTIQCRLRYAKQTLARKMAVMYEDNLR